jgi:hypothetical protein
METSGEHTRHIFKNRPTLIQVSKRDLIKATLLLFPKFLRQARHGISADDAQRARRLRASKASGGNVCSLSPACLVPEPASAATVQGRAGPAFHRHSPPGAQATMLLTGIRLQVHRPLCSSRERNHKHMIAGGSGDGGDLSRRSKARASLRRYADEKLHIGGKEMKLGPRFVVFKAKSDSPSSPPPTPHTHASPVAGSTNSLAAPASSKSGSGTNG